MVSENQRLPSPVDCDNMAGKRDLEGDAMAAMRQKGRRRMDSVLVLVLGVLLGLVSKYLDCTPSNELPGLLTALDVRNFLGRFAIWLLIGLWLSVSSGSPGRAAVKGFLFFFGMVSAYYLYSKFLAGFFPRRYAMVWFGCAAISPLLSSLCWYAGGKGKGAFALSAALLAVLFWCSFVGGWLYLEPRSGLELLTFLGGVAVLRRDTLKASALMTVLGMVLGFVLLLIVPVHFG